MEKRSMRIMILENEDLITAQYREVTEEEIITDIISTILKSKYQNMDQIKEMENAVDYYQKEIEEIIKKIKSEM